MVFAWFLYVHNICTARLWFLYSTGAVIRSPATYEHQLKPGVNTVLSKLNHEYEQFTNDNEQYVYNLNTCLFTWSTIHARTLRTSTLDSYLQVFLIVGFKSPRCQLGEAVTYH